MHGIQRERRHTNPGAEESGVSRVVVRYADGRVMNFVPDARRASFHEDDVAVAVVLTEADGLAGKLAPPEVPEDPQVVVYPLDPPSVTGLRAVAALAGQDTLPLCGEFLNRTHNTLCHHSLPALA